MKIHFYLDENEGSKDITNFDFAREIAKACDDLSQLDLKTIITMLEAQSKFQERENNL